MRQLHILQIGDIHHPDHSGIRTVDLKDTGFSPGVVASVSEDKLRGPMKCAARLADQHSPLIAVCGDLTSGAQREHYERAVGLIKGVFDLEQASADRNYFHVAIGNHDVDRTAVSTSKESGLDKYAMARTAWAPDEILGILEPRNTSIGDGTVAAHVWTMNTCVGSGEYRNMPRGVRDTIQHLVATALEPYASQAADELGTSALAVDEIYEQLDTPALEAKHLDAVVQEIGRLPRNAVPIVLAHHNLLPQAEPRIAAYTELVNSGSARTRFASCDRAVIYLHGHIHASAVEVVEQHQPNRGRVVCVSAPLLADGFNHLSVQFSDSGRLLGLIVTPYRTQRSGAVTAEPVIRISLVDPVGQDHRLLSDLGRVFSSESINVRMGDLIDRVKSAAYRTKPTDSEVVDAVIEAEWMGRVTIQNREYEHENWRVRNA